MNELPSQWLADHGDALPASGRALDVACGRGRNAIWLAERGLRTEALDRDEEAVRVLNEEARSRGLPLEAGMVDLESGVSVLGVSSYDVVVVVHYLHRPLFPQLIASLRPGGLLVYETFTTAQAARGRPTNPAFLLNPGELRELAKPLEILDEREGEFDGRMIASLVARSIKVLRFHSSLYSTRNFRVPYGLSSMRISTSYSPAGKPPEF